MSQLFRQLDAAVAAYPLSQHMRSARAQIAGAINKQMSAR